MREVGPHVVHEGSGVGALAMAVAYLTVDGSSDIEISDVGPAEAYFNDVAGDIEVSTTPVGTQRSLLKVSDDYYLI